MNRRPVTGSLYPPRNGLSVALSMLFRPYEFQRARSKSGSLPASPSVNRSRWRLKKPMNSGRVIPVSSPPPSMDQNTLLSTGLRMTSGSL